MRFHLSKKAGLAVCAALSLLLPACQNGGNFSLFGYTTQPNYRTNIRTVRIKIFNNKTYRQGLEFQLTEALVREIEQFTPYKVVNGNCAADTELVGTVSAFSKGILNINNVNEERDVQTILGVEFSWRDLRTGEYLSKAARRPGEVVEVPAPVGPIGPLPLSGVPGAPAPTILTTPTLPGVVPGGPGNTLIVTATTHYVPELGQSLATAMQDNVNQMARQIRELMETPW